MSQNQREGGKIVLLIARATLWRGLPNLLTSHYTKNYIQINFDSWHFVCISCDHLNFSSNLHGS